jgi:GNAT superfamily N-acetyltransferase
MIYQITEKEISNPEFVRLARSFYEGSGLPGSFRQAHFIKSWNQFFELGVGAIWVCAEKDLSAIYGAIGGLIHPDLYDGALVAQELFWFVESKAGFKASIQLYEQLEHWAKIRGAIRLNMACVCNKHMASLRRFYEKRGFRPVDVSYFKDLS